jgi:hypothetical protein
MAVYGGGSLVAIFGKFNSDVVLATHDRTPTLNSYKYFLGLHYNVQLSQNAGLVLSAEVAFQEDSQAYSLRTAFQF